MDRAMFRIHLDRDRATFHTMVVRLRMADNLQVIVVRALREGIHNRVLLQASLRILLRPLQEIWPQI
jgi:hypothetical protein